MELPAGRGGRWHASASGEKRTSRALGHPSDRRAPTSRSLRTPPPSPPRPRAPRFSPRRPPRASRRAPSSSPPPSARADLASPASCFPVIPKYGPKYGRGSSGPIAAAATFRSAAPPPPPPPASASSAARSSAARTTMSRTRAASGSASAALRLPRAPSPSPPSAPRAPRPPSPSTSFSPSPPSSASSAEEEERSLWSLIPSLSPRAVSATWPYAAMRSASALPWSFFRRSVPGASSGNIASAMARLASLSPLAPLCARPSAHFHACGLTILTSSPALARTPRHRPKLYPCTNAVCAEKPYSTPPSSRCATWPGGRRSDARAATIASAWRRVRSLPFTSTFTVGQSMTSTEATTPTEGPRTIASAPPASESHPTSTQPEACDDDASDPEARGTGWESEDAAQRGGARRAGRGGEKKPGVSRVGAGTGEGAATLGNPRAARGGPDGARRADARDRRAPQGRDGPARGGGGARSSARESRARGASRAKTRACAERARASSARGTRVRRREQRVGGRLFKICRESVQMTARGPAGPRTDSRLIKLVTGSRFIGHQVPAPRCAPPSPRS